MSEPGVDRRSLTPCLDENGVEDESCGLDNSNSKEIELSDISDIDDESWQACNKAEDGSRTNGNGAKAKESSFKKVTGNRGRNYRDNLRRNSDFDHHRPPTQSFQHRRYNEKRRDIERYNVRKVVATRDFSISRSRSRSRSFTPPRQRDPQRKRSASPNFYRPKNYKSPPSRKFSPLSSRHSRSPSVDRFRSYQHKRSPTPEIPPRRSRSRRRGEKIRSEKLSKRKKHKSKERPRKHKKSRSKSKPHRSSSPSLSPEPARSVTSQIKGATNTNPAQEKIKVILKNEEALNKRQKTKKREKKSKMEGKADKEVSKEVFASGDNILISVCFNNNNNNNSKGEPLVLDPCPPAKSKTKRRHASPVAESPLSSASREGAERRQRKHRRKKTKNKREHITATKTQEPSNTKRKSDMKPIAIIDLEKSPGKEVTQSPKEVIVLSDSDGEAKKTSKDVIIIDDVILEKSKNKAPESPAAPSQPAFKFALKSKTNILPFNLLHDQAEEIDEQLERTGNGNEKMNQSLDSAGNLNDDKNANQREAYDPFEPTKSGSTSPSTPPPPNDVSSSSDKLKSKVDSPPKELTAKEAPQILEDTLISSSIRSWKDKPPNTPPLPPTFNMFSGNATAKQHVSLYDGIFSSDLKTPVQPSPAKKHDEKKIDSDRTPYSPSSDGYDFEPPPASNPMDSQDNNPGSGSSYTFGSNDDIAPKTTPLKLTASTLKTFNSTMRSQGPVGLSYVNKTELNMFENYLPASQNKSPMVKRPSRFLQQKISRFTNSLIENGSPAAPRGSMNYHDMKPPVIDNSIIDDDVPNSAVDLINKDKFLKKSLRLERVAEEVKLVLKPHYNKKHLTKEEYKDILRKAVPKICHNKTGEINIQKIHALVEAYIKKIRYKRKAGHIASSI